MDFLSAVNQISQLTRLHKTTMETSIYVLIFLVVLGVLFVGLLQINQMRLIEKVQQQIFADYAFDFVTKIPRFD